MGAWLALLLLAQARIPYPEGGGVVIPNHWSRPSVGKIVGSTDVTQIFTVDFEFQTEGALNAGSSILHIGDTQDFAAPRIAVSSTGGFLVTVSTTGDPNNGCDTGAIVAGTHHFHLEVDATLMQVFIDGELACSKVSSLPVRIASFEPIWFSDRFGTAPADIQIRYLVIRTDEFSDRDLARGRPATKSSEYPNHPASCAVDGILDPNFYHWHCACTSEQHNPWLRIDLGAEKTVGSVRVLNRGDCCPERLDQLHAYIGNNPNNFRDNTLCGFHESSAAGELLEIECAEPLTGRYAFIALTDKKNFLTVCGVQVFPPFKSGYFLSPKSSWEAAQEYCKSHKARLAVLRKPEKAWEANAFCKDKDCGWIGARCPSADHKCENDGNGCNWFWMRNDGEKAQCTAYGYTTWRDEGGSKAFSVNEKYCATLEGSFEWGSAKCSEERVGLCEKWNGDVPQTYLDGLAWRISADAYTSGNIVDSVGGMQFEAKPTVQFQGQKAWNFEVITRNGGPALDIEQRYTHAYWINWRRADAGWRTLMRTSANHLALVETGKRSLGSYSVRNGQFRDTLSYDIVTDEWQLFIGTGLGDCFPTCATGVSRFYIARPNADGLVFVGSTDRVGSGTSFLSVGWHGQPPGALSDVMYWNRILSPREMEQLMDAGAPKYFPDCDMAQLAQGLLMNLDPTVGNLDPISGMTVSSLEGPTTYDGSACWDLVKGQLTYSTGAFTVVTRSYTFAYWVYWRESNQGLRLLGLNFLDGIAGTDSGSNELGMFSLRNGGFQGSGYEISTEGWQLVIAVGRGDCDDCATGTQEFYVANSDKVGVQKVGQVPSAASGTIVYMWGLFGGYGAGNLGGMMYWDRALDISELRYVWKVQKLQYGYEALDPPPPIGSDQKVKRGSIVIEGWTGGTACQFVTMKEPFKSNAYHVQLTVSHREMEGDVIHPATAAWIEDMHPTKFKVCIRENSPRGSGSHGEAHVDWVAYQELASAKGGEVRYPRWSALNKCKWIEYTKPFSTPPRVQLTINHRAALVSSVHPATVAWTQNIMVDRFRACVRVLEGQGHDNTLGLMWVAYPDRVEVWKEKKVMTETGIIAFPPLNDVKCENIGLGFPKSAPQIMATATRDHVASLTKINNPAIVWTENISAQAFRLCVRVVTGKSDTPLEALKISWLAVGEFWEPPSPGEIIQEVLAIHIETKRWLIEAIELLATEDEDEEKENPIIFQSGGHKFNPWGVGAVCEDIKFEKAFKARPNEISIQLTPTFTSSAEHVPLLSWTETITEEGFKACVQAPPSMNSGYSRTDMKLDWIAYVGTPSNTQTAELLITDNWTKMKCNDVRFDSNYNVPPTVLVTLNYRSGKPIHAATAVWIEKIVESHFTVCVADNGDVNHDSKLRVSWMSFGEIPGFGREKGRIQVPEFPEGSSDYCGEFQFGEKYAAVPNIQMSLSHVTGRTPQHNPIVLWADHVEKEKFTYCLRTMQSSPSTVHQGATIEFVTRLMKEGGPAAHDVSIEEKDDVPQRGFFTVPRWSDGNKCVEIGFAEPYEDSEVHVFVSASHRDHTKKTVHDAVGVWVEAVFNDKFIACIREFPRPGEHDGNAKLEWMAFRKTSNAQYDKIPLPAWVNTFCQVVTFPLGFSVEPIVLTTISHQPSDIIRPLLSWVEEVTAETARICVKSYSDTYAHDDSAFLTYIAMDANEPPFQGLSTRHGEELIEVEAGKTNCVGVSYQFDAAPVVVCGPSHGVFDGEANHAAALVWFEGITAQKAKLCAYQTRGTLSQTLSVNWLALEIQPDAVGSVLQMEQLQSVQVMTTIGEQTELLAVLGGELANKDE